MVVTKLQRALILAYTFFVILSILYAPFNLKSIKGPELELGYNWILNMPTAQEDKRVSARTSFYQVDYQRIYLNIGLYTLVFLPLIIASPRKV